MTSQSDSPDIRALLHERLDAMLQDCETVMDNAAFGQTVHDLDDFLIVAGQKFLQEVYQQKLQERIEQTENAAETKQCSQCKKKTHYQNKKTKILATARGHVTMNRTARQCPHCDHYSFPVDVTLGISTDYTNGLTRLVARCCGFWSYRLAADNLQEFCGVHLSHTTIGKIADQTAEKIATKLQDNSEIRNEFQKAKGETEFTTDGTCVHIRNDDGIAEWREMKVGAFAKRERGESAAPSEWATRKLPEPTVVSAFAAIESKEEFQERCQNERRRVGVGGVSSALGDGALWIWSLVFTVFGWTRECLDIYHALEHVSACGKILYGNGQAFTDWLDRMRLVLLSEGFAGMERELSVLLSGKLEESERASVVSLLNYLRKNEGRLNYAERLAAGRSIGSGLIEGACKNLVGKRLKQTGACWRASRANRIATICAVLYSNQWKQCWKKSS